MNTNSIDAIKDHLKDGFVDVFSTMLNITATPIDALKPTPSGPMVAGSVGFTGDVSGVAYIYVDDAFGKSLACRMLGLTEAELEGEEMVNDVIGEISNMIVGAAKSRICDTGALCTLTIPSIVRGDDFGAKPASNSESRLFSMQCEAQTVHVELIMKVE
jgi:chemotaxis protein CheX